MAATATLLLIIIAFGLVLANLKRIVLNRLQATFPELRVSVADVSLKSLSHLLIIGLELSGPRGASGSFVRMPAVDVRYRFDPFRGLVLNSVDLPGAQALLRPGVGAILSSLAGAARRTAEAQVVPRGPAIGKISLTHSTLAVRTPHFNLACSLDLLADSSSSGILLDNTDLSLRLRDLSLDLPSFRLRDVNSQFAALIAREPTGSRIDVLRGGLAMPKFLQSDFSGYLSFEDSALSARCQVDVTPFNLTDVLKHLKDSFPELDAYRIEGQANARLEVRYRSANRPQLSLSGRFSLRRGRAVLPVPKLLVVDEVQADIPFRYSTLDGETSLSLGSHERHLSGATLAASRLACDDQELATDLLASFELDNDVIKSLNAFFRSHGGTVSARLSGSLRDDRVSLKGDFNGQDIGLDGLLRHFGIKSNTVWGRVSGKGRFACTAGPETAFSLQGEFRSRVPLAIISLQKPLTVRGLEVAAPFEYSVASSVQPFCVTPSGRHPLGGSITAEEIGYGEKIEEDGTSTPQWSVSAFWANVASTGNTSQLSIKSCRAYDGQVTGNLTASLGEKGVSYRGELNVRNLDLETLVKGLGVRKNFYISGLAEGAVTVSGKQGRWDHIRIHFSAIPPGGIIRIQDLQRFLESMQSEVSKAASDALKKGFTPQQWEEFVEGMKDFRYSLATVNMTFRPLWTRLGVALRPEGEIQLVGTGAGETFKITIPFIPHPTSGM